MITHSNHVQRQPGGVSGGCIPGTATADRSGAKDLVSTVSRLGPVVDFLLSQLPRRFGVGGFLEGVAR